MTDNEITTALECCNQPVGSGACNKCPFDYQRQKRLAKDEQSCTNLMICNALDLINRQKAEIERLREAGEEAVSCFNRMQSLYNIKCVELKVAKNQAYEEFAERLNDTKFKQGNDYIIYADNVSTVAKELKEGVNNDGV